MKGTSLALKQAKINLENGLFRSNLRGIEKCLQIWENC